MFLKLIERDGGFQVIEARTVAFRRHPEAVAIVDQGLASTRTFPLVHNAYLLNDAGKTIETFIINGDRKAPP